MITDRLNVISQGLSELIDLAMLTDSSDDDDYNHETLQRIENGLLDLEDLSHQLGI